MPPIYVPPEPDHGEVDGHGTFDGRDYRVIRYRSHYSVTFRPALPMDAPTIERAIRMLCQSVAKVDVRSTEPHRTPPNETWVFDVGNELCMGMVFRTTNPQSTIVSIQKVR